MTEEQKQEETTEAEVEEVESVELEEDDEDDYQEPITGEEVKEVVAETVTYVKDAVFQPGREIVREGFDAITDFARGLGGRKRKRKKD